jgi:hypothetical protein
VHRVCSVFHTQIIQDIEEQYDNHPDVIHKFGLPTEHSPVELYLSRRKINAQYSLNNKSQTIDTDALMTYAVKDEAELALINLKEISSFNKSVSATASMFIPLNAKYTAPAKFGECVARHNAFLSEHRNIAIVGLAPAAMDFPDDTNQTLWSSIRVLPGVYRCDPCRRTPDLGEWNISCALAEHPAICAWLDLNLVPLWESIANKDQIPKIATFPIPERLLKGRHVSSASSVASGLTDASPVEDYFRQLESHFPIQNPPTTTTFRNAWNTNPPVDDIAYSFTPTEFPNLPPSDMHYDTSLLFGERVPRWHWPVGF